jgi:hypothetical protein
MGRAAAQMEADTVPRVEWGLEVNINSAIKGEAAMSTILLTGQGTLTSETSAIW